MPEETIFFNKNLLGIEEGADVGVVLEQLPLPRTNSEPTNNDNQISIVRWKHGPLTEG